jgi:hypothetical protein
MPAPIAAEMENAVKKHVSSRPSAPRKVRPPDPLEEERDLLDQIRESGCAMRGQRLVRAQSETGEFKPIDPTASGGPLPPAGGDG